MLFALDQSCDTPGSRVSCNRDSLPVPLLEIFEHGREFLSRPHHRRLEEQGSEVFSLAPDQLIDAACRGSCAEERYSQVDFNCRQLIERQCVHQGLLTGRRTESVPKHDGWVTLRV